MLLAEQQIRSGTLVLALLEVDSLRGLLLDSAPALLNIPRASLREALPTVLAGSAEDAGGAAARAAASTGKPSSAANTANASNAGADAGTPAASPVQPAMPSM